MREGKDIRLDIRHFSYIGENNANPLQYSRQPVLNSGGHGDDLGAGDPYWLGVISRTTVSTEVSIRVGGQDWDEGMDTYFRGITHTLLWGKKILVHCVGKHYDYRTNRTHP